MARSPRSRRLIVIEIVVVGLVLTITTIVSLKRHLELQSRYTCLNNVRQMVLAISMGGSDTQGLYPNKALIWQEVNFPPKALVCPTYGATKGNGYGYNIWLSNKVLEDFSVPPQELPVITDSAHPDHLLSSNKDIRLAALR